MKHHLLRQVAEEIRNRINYGFSTNMTEDILTKPPEAHL